MRLHYTSVNSYTVIVVMILFILIILCTDGAASSLDRLRVIILETMDNCTDTKASMSVIYSWWRVVLFFYHNTIILSVVSVVVIDMYDRVQASVEGQFTYCDRNY